MKQMNITGNYAKLEEIYIQKILNISKNIGFSYAVWQEVFDNGVVVCRRRVVYKINALELLFLEL